MGVWDGGTKWVVSSPSWDEVMRAASPCRFNCPDKKRPAFFSHRLLWLIKVMAQVKCRITGARTHTRAQVTGSNPHWKWRWTEQRTKPVTPEMERRGLQFKHWSYNCWDLLGGEDDAQVLLTRWWRRRRGVGLAGGKRGHFWLADCEVPKGHEGFREAVIHVPCLAGDRLPVQQHRLRSSCNYQV